MKYAGKLIEAIDCEGPEDVFNVPEAVVTTSRLSIDWIEDGELWHFDATSRDGGMTYQGHYGFARPEPGCRMELKRYTAKDGSLLLLGTWRESDTGNEGYSLFQLEPV